MIKFKEPTEADLQVARELDWIVSLGDEENTQLQVIRINECYHTEGGRYGNNDFYAYPLKDGAPTLENITPFNGGVNWSYDVIQRNYYGKHGIELGTYYRIFCGGEQVYEGRASFDLAGAVARVKIAELQESPIDISIRGYEEKLIGRRVYFNGKPGVITRYIKSQGSVIIHPDGVVPNFGRHLWETDEDYKYSYEGYVKEDILAKSITWWRYDENGNTIFDDYAVVEDGEIIG